MNSTSTPHRSQPILIGGPTGSGKSALAMHLAEKIHAEIVSVDSFCIYKGLDIGTSKPTNEDQRRVPHHLINLVNPLESFSVSDYLNHAGRVLSDLKNRNVHSIWVGGSGLYFRALRQGLCEAPASDPDILSELESWDIQALADELMRVDPEWCRTADLKNKRRLTRALAVWKQTGIPLSTWQKKNQTQPLLPESQVPIFYLNPSPDLLKEKIAERVHKMFLDGWVEEVKKLMQLNGWLESQSAAALGYRTVAEFLEGKCTQEECTTSIIQQTLQFAKRQRTWFRAEKNLHIRPEQTGCWNHAAIEKASDWIITAIAHAK